MPTDILKKNISLMEDIYTIVDKAIDIAFEERKFQLNFYDFMKSCKTQELEQRSLITVQLQKS